MKLYTPRIPEPREPILPLVNIVFLLLIFFMLAGKLAEPDAFDVSPPQSASQSAAEAQPVTVSIAADGRLAIGGEELAIDDLQTVITDPDWLTRQHSNLSQSADPTQATGDAAPVAGVRLKADGQVDTQHVIEVMEILRSAGVEKVWMLTIQGDG